MKYEEFMSYMSKEDFFNVLVDLYDFLENGSEKELREVLSMFVNYKVDKKYIDYLREIYKVED